MRLPDALLAALLVLPLALALTPQAAAAECRPETCIPPEAVADLPRLDGDLTLRHLLIDVSVVEAVARTTIRMEVQNQNAHTETAVLRVPLPRQGVLLGFQLDGPGGLLEGDVIETRGIQVTTNFTDVRLLRADDALLEVELEARSGVVWTLEATYAEFVPLVGGSRVHWLPLSGFGHRPVLMVDASFVVFSQHGIQDARFPLMEMRLQSNGTTFAQSAYRVGALAEVDPLVAIWTEGPGTWLVSMLCEREPTGGFVEGLALANARGLAPLGRDVVFALDRSASMGGNKIEQAREALVEGLASLAPDDRYGLLAFDSELFVVQPTLFPAAESASDARVVSDVEPQGATNIDAALQEALRILADGNAAVADVVLITDGFPTTGVVDHGEIRERFLSANARGARLHVVAIGIQADRSFLADIVTATGGSLVVLEDGEDLGERIRGFLDRLEGPIVANVQASISGFVHGEELVGPFPSLLQDTTMAIAFGDDWPQGVTVDFAVNGTGASGPTGIRQEIAQGECMVFSPAGPLAARTHVQALLSNERVQGASTSLQTDIVEVAMRHRLTSPYTTWVLTDGASATTPVYGIPADQGDPTTPPEPRVRKDSSAVGTTLLVVLVAFAVWRRRRSI